MKILRNIFLGVLIVVLLVVGFVAIRYFSWKNQFFNGMENVVCTHDEDFNEEVNLLDRIENFVMSAGKTEFMTFTQREMLLVLRNSMKQNETFNIDQMCLVSQKGIWRVYLHPKVDFLQLPWVGMDIVKDNRETLEVYSNGFYIGDMEVPRTFAKKFLGDVNKGISDAIILVIENNFLGKSIQNIDLLEDSIVIKGVR